MPIIKPNRSNKKWIVSYLGEYFGDIINAFCVDLFSKQGKIKPGSKLGIISDLGLPYSFVRASIKEEEERKDKIWAVIPQKVLRSPSDSRQFEEDASSGFFADEIIDAGSDIVSVSDNSKEDITSIVVSTPVGEEQSNITGIGSGIQIAQSFNAAEGNAHLFRFALKINGSPTDALKVSIYDGEEEPENELAYALIYPYELSDTFKLIEKKIEDFNEPIEFDFEKKYWIAFSRTGTGSLYNFYSVLVSLSEKDPYEGNELLPKPQAEMFMFITDTFTANGTWSVPSGVSEAFVECWGAGGGGSTNVGGGGGGAYSAKLVSGLSGNKSVVVGTSSANANGGDSSFDTNVVLAKGGRSGANGGTGGQAGDGIGDTKYSGGNGALGTGERGGGGGAGSEGSGGNASGEYPGMGGSKNGGIGGGKILYGYAGEPPQPQYNISNTGRIIGGGGRSTGTEQYAGARGEVRITYKVPIPQDYPAVAGRTWNRGDRIIVPPAANIGDLLLAVITTDGANTLTLPGWTKLKELSQSTNCTQSIFYKRAVAGDNSGRIENVSYANSIVYRIINAGVPTATQASGASSVVNPPEHNAGSLRKHLWIAAASWRATDTAIGISAPPTNYKELIITPEWTFQTGNKDGITALAQRNLEAQTENPSTFSSDSAASWVAATIAIPRYAANYYNDATISVKVKIPQAEERLLLSTGEDIKLLGKENTRWYSLWQNLLRQKPLNKNYPRVLKTWGANEIIFVGNDNIVSSIAKPTGGVDYGSFYIDYERLKFPPNYFINWIATTERMIFIGLRNKLSPYLPSMVSCYEPLTESRKDIEIPEGETIGFVQDGNCHIIDKTGQLRVYNGISFVPYDYMPVYFSEQKIITLPHRNGFACDKNNLLFLWEGQSYYPAGIWIYEKTMKRLYHTASLWLSNNRGYGSVCGEGGWGALFNNGDGLLCGGSLMDENSEVVKGIFGDMSPTRCWFYSNVIDSPEIEDNWHDIYLKYRPKAKIIPKFKVKDFSIENPSYNGEWISEDKFSSEADLEVGDEITIKKGKRAGLVSTIIAKDGNQFTISEPDEETTSGQFVFTIEKNWQGLNPLVSFNDGDKISVGSVKAGRFQFKCCFEDCELEELQISRTANLKLDLN